MGTSGYDYAIGGAVGFGVLSIGFIIYKAIVIIKARRYQNLNYFPANPWEGVPIDPWTGEKIKDYEPELRV